MAKSQSPSPTRTNPRLGQSSTFDERAALSRSPPQALLDMGNPLSSNAHLNPILLNSNEIDIRSTMQEIIDGYPFTEHHKQYIEQDRVERMHLSFDSRQPLKTH